MTSDVSVIIPFYNREQFIDEAVQSALGQTLPPLEIILVNDHSRESSRRVLDRYAGVCRIIDLPVNVGLSGARNAGIAAARGRFVAFLDDDDIWLPRKLQLQRRYLEENPGCAAVHAVACLFFSHRADLRCKMFDSRPLSLAQALTHEQWVIPSTLLIRMDAVRSVGGFDPRFRECEDRDFVIRCCAMGHRIDGIDEPLVRMRREGHHHLMKRHFRMFRAHVRICWKHRHLYHCVYGSRGIASFLMSSLHQATRETPYADGAVRRLMRLVKIRWQVRPGYRDPVCSETQIA